MRSHDDQPLKPPRWGDYLLESFCAPQLLEEVQGDLHELYCLWVKEFGEQKANRLYLWHTLKFFRLYAVKRNTPHIHINPMEMFYNYFKIGLRNILRYKVFSFINVFGLAVALSVCMLIILMLADQKSYDQFHEKKERTYRILSKVQDSMTPNASSPMPLTATLKVDYPMIEDATQLIPGVGGDAMYEQKTVEMRGLFADSSFFDVFSFELEKGNKDKALDLPNSMVISSETAAVLFGNEDPLGKSVAFTDRGLRLSQLDFGSETESNPVSWGNFIITGVLDSKKYKSHIKFDALVSAASLPALYQQEKISNLSDSWERYSYCYTYAVLHPEQNEQNLTASLDQLVARQYAEFEGMKGFQLIPQKLTQITPGIFVGNPLSLRLPLEAYYFLGFLAMIILLSACLNYTNLSTARALTRAKEIGVRKVNGAKRKDLIYQFLSESVLTVLFSLALAHLLLFIIQPAFMGLWANQFLNFDLNGNMLVHLIFLGLALLIGLVAGTYPALYLSRFAPTKVLKNLASEKPGKLSMRKALIASQFIVSLFFIITSILVGKQFRYYLEFEYGFESENIVNIPLQGNDYQLLKHELNRVAGVSAISASQYIPATAMSNGTGVKIAGTEDDPVHFEHLSVDTGFVTNLGLEIVAGRNLPAEGNEDRFVLINEVAAKSLGYNLPSEMIGQLLEVNTYEEPVEVIGIMKDARFQTPVMEEEIGPLMFRNQTEKFSYLNVKLASADLKETVAALEDQWKIIDPVHPFKYQFFDDQLVKVNQWLGDLVAIISFIAFLAIVIACLGMLGMATYTAERRTKEVGIRKVLGAENLNVALLLSKSFMKILFISIGIAAPLSYFINNLWLQNFPNRVAFGFGIVLMGSLILLVLGGIAICSQTLRVARKNPVDTLRIE
ncbi:ABC transporter permease [Catalinimonas niigatensis]|uniref:ABC transporter permease n=1 Tax=Catalinimonas niigatensis TaxID=1397264 RepID=UPI00266527CF|nr:ABC transporter permease [Catalinimonas niigatensis]WPP52701.1 permease prefix domain 2-containing transporter [Catalinimonas niigatensis]